MAASRRSARTVGAAPRLLHAVPGRVRLHWPLFLTERAPALEVVLDAVPGALRISASALTGNVLFEVDPELADGASVLAAIAEIDARLAGELAEEPPPPAEAEADAVLGVVSTEAEGLPVGRPQPGEVIDATGRLVGSAIGLGLLQLRRLVRGPEPMRGAATAALLAAGEGVLEGVPAVRHAALRRFGPGPTDLAFAGAGLLMLTISNSPVGLAVSLLISLRELTEARARGAAWRRYSEMLRRATRADPGAHVRLEAGERTPLCALVLEGTGTATGRDALPLAAEPGAVLPAGAELHGGSFRLALRPLTESPAVRADTSTHEEIAWLERYVWVADASALACAVVVGLASRSAARALTALLLLSPRPALDGREAADRGASARILRAGATALGPRTPAALRKPDVIVLDGLRVAADGLEIASVVPLTSALDDGQVAALARDVSAAAGEPWGPLDGPAHVPPGSSGRFDGSTARARLGGQSYSLAVGGPGDGFTLVLKGARGRRLGLVSLRPRAAPALRGLQESCRRYGIELAVAGSGAATAAGLGLSSLADDAAAAAIARLRSEGRRVAVVSDTPESAAAFAAANLAIGLSAGRTRAFPAPVDLLAPDLAVVAEAAAAGERRDRAARDTIWLSAAANAVGALWLFARRPTVRAASTGANLARAAALVTAWARLRGGRPHRSSIALLVDPRPERWARVGVARTLRALGSRLTGLTHREAASRLLPPESTRRVPPLVGAMREQLASPLTVFLAAGAVLSLATGAVGDVLLIATVIVANAAIGAFQEARVDRASEELERLTGSTAAVLRGGSRTRVPAAEVVPGDILLLSHGERVAADARLIKARGLEVDESPLTGESLPVRKDPHGPDAARVVLAGSDVAVGHGRAVAVAVGPDTRLGTTAAALGLEREVQGPLGRRLGSMVMQCVPAAGAGALVILLAGLLHRRPLVGQLALAASTAVAAVPEALPLIAGTGQAAVAQRLAERRALVRRLGAVEALGRVDIACVDKTGTLTEGRLAVELVAAADGTSAAPDRLAPELRDVLLSAAFACPRPESFAAGAHVTDAAVLAAADTAGLAEALTAKRGAEAPFDPARPFHAVVAAGRLRVKGSPEALLPRCDRMRLAGREVRLTSARRRALADRAERLAAEGLRVLLVAEGTAQVHPADPRPLVAVGLLGISDALRPGVAAAVRRCQAAGVRLVMLTGDHPATARTVARKIGLAAAGVDILTGADIERLEEDELARRLEQGAVVARISPLEKLRVVQSLQGRGHVVAMTGDGVNDAPALRLADVGVAMGLAGTQVACEAADVVLADDDFSTLVEALIEGRSFWQSTRRALAMLLGGNLGEVGFIAAWALLGLPGGLTTRQVLAVNLGSDVLPAFSLAVQAPAQRDLSALAREGTASLGAPLVRDIRTRALATAVPSLAASAAALRAGVEQAQAVGYGSIIATQVAQSFDTARRTGRSTGPAAAAAASFALVAASLTLPPLRRALALAAPTRLGWLLIGGSTAGAVLMARALGSDGRAASSSR